jgi:lupus La protein
LQELPVAELTAEEEEGIRARLLKQIDFYFGDGNYARDRFLRSKAREDPGGWIRLEVSLRHFSGSLS